MTHITLITVFVEFLFTLVLRKVDTTTPLSKLGKDGSSLMIEKFQNGICKITLKVNVLEVTRTKAKMPICCSMRESTLVLMVAVFTNFLKAIVYCN